MEPGTGLYPRSLAEPVSTVQVPCWRANLVRCKIGVWLLCRRLAEAGSHSLSFWLHGASIAKPVIAVQGPYWSGHMLWGAVLSLLLLCRYLAAAGSHVAELLAEPKEHAEPVTAVQAPCWSRRRGCWTGASTPCALQRGTRWLARWPPRSWTASPPPSSWMPTIWSPSLRPA